MQLHVGVIHLEDARVHCVACVVEIQADRRSWRAAFLSVTSVCSACCATMNARNIADPAGPRV